MTHAWCSDPSRDAAVRAAEDNRAGPLPTLDDAIAMLPKSGSATLAVDHENKGDDMTMRDKQAADYRAEAAEAPAGLRTERVTLEIAHDWRDSPCDWDWDELLRFKTNTLADGESVRVVEEPTGSVDDRAYADRMGCDEERDFANRILDERDAAIRERNSLREQLESVACRAATAETALEAVSGGEG